MTDYVSLDTALTECAMIVVANDGLNNEARAIAALRHSGFSAKFVGAMWDEIIVRANEMKDTFGYSKNVVFLNAHAGTVH